MFELADSGSSGDLPLLCSPLSLSPPFSLSLFYLSTCYATLCHAALAQVCDHVPRSNAHIESPVYAFIFPLLLFAPFSSRCMPANVSSFLLTFLPATFLLLYSPVFLHERAARSSVGGERRRVSPLLRRLRRTYLYLRRCTCAEAYCHAQWLDRADPVHWPMHRSRRLLLFYLSAPGTLAG